MWQWTAYVLPLSISLKGRCIDILTAMTDVNYVIYIFAIDECQFNMNRLGHEWYTRAYVSDYVRRNRRSHEWRQLYRANTPAATPQQYFHRTFTFPFITYLLTEMKPLFTPMQKRAAHWLLPELNQ